MPKLTELISGPNRWIKYKSSTDINGLWKEPTDPEACRFCIMGAIRRKTGYKDNPVSSPSDYDETAPEYPAFKENILKIVKVLQPDRDESLALIRHIGVIIDFNDDPSTNYAKVQEVLTKVEHE